MIWAADTEDNSKGKVYLINFFDGEKHHTFREPADAVEWLSKQSSRLEIWCVNLAYDLSNIFQGLMRVLEVTYIKGRVIQAKIRGTQVYFKDTLNHWKMSVEEMGKRIGLPKFKSKSFNNVRYCRRDTEICYRFVISMKEKYEGFGAKLKSTIGSTTLDLYYSRFGDKPTSHIFSRDDIDWMLGGYYGGRVEIFHWKPIMGRIHYMDFNSLYPSCMRGHDFPVLRGHRFRVGLREETEGICEATVHVPDDISLPYLPIRSPQGLIFPTGTFTGRWTHFELREAQKYGVKILKAHRSKEFTGTFQPFDEFVDTLYKSRLAATAENDLLMSTAAKDLMNNLYGKFGQGNEITHLFAYDETNLKHGDEMYGDLVLRNETKAYPMHTNVVWAAYTTAYGRDALYRGLLAVKAHGGTPIYCDTDSIIFEGDNPFHDSQELGGLKSEGQYSHAHFKLPKLYRLIGDKKSITRAKGVSKSAQNDFFEKGIAEFMRPNKLRESLRRKLVPNEWHLTRKEMRREYDKRIRNADGSTSPLRLPISEGPKNPNRVARKNKRDSKILRDAVRTI